MTYTTTAIILQRRPFREADLWVTFFSQELGKLEAAAIGAKKIQSKLAGQLEPLQEVKVMLAKGRDFDKVGQAVLLNNFGIQTIDRPEPIWQAQQAVALVERFVRVGQKEKGLYSFLRDFLALNFGKRFVKNLFYAFIFRLFDLVGFAPELEKCLRCRQVIAPGQNYFSFSGGGLICSACLSHQQKEKPLVISNEAIKAWRYLRGHSLAESLSLRIPEKLFQELNQLSNNFLDYHIK